MSPSPLRLRARADDLNDGGGGERLAGGGGERLAGGRTLSWRSGVKSGGGGGSSCGWRAVESGERPGGRPDACRRRRRVVRQS